MIERVQKYRFIVGTILVALLLAGRGWAGSQARPTPEQAAPDRGWARLGLEFPGPAPGDGQGEINQSELVIENKILSCTWDISEGRLKPKRVADKLSATTLTLREAECFQLILDDGQIVKSSEMKIIGEPKMKNLDCRQMSLEPQRTSCRLAERFGGKQITVVLISSDTNLKVQWRAILRDGSNYVRQQIVFTTKNEPIEVKEIVLLEMTAPHAEVLGTVDGSPVVAGNMFFAYEHPLSKSQIMQSYRDLFRCSLPCRTTLKPGESLVQSSVIGVVPQGQLRRGFLYYIERERAHPYRPFLHYNSWYDIGYRDEKIEQRQCLEVIELFGRELVKRRSIMMDSFALDDGWDDTASLWQFHKGLPNGFAPLQQEAEKYDSALGAWLSPFGGYGQAKQERLKYGREQGFETNKSGFSLAGPKYYARFRDVCVNMVREYGLNYFKFDGIGTVSRPTGADAEFVQDMQALLQLISELRGVKPDLFVNITSGTWPSPYWLWYGDSTWRAGKDWGTAGWGSERQQQITYRDMETYHNVVSRAPLYPLNSLMTQGIMLANHGLPNQVDGLVEDIHAFFASGTNCQELYITPSMMRPQDWDTLSEAAKWSGDNADVLVDTHWVGGDPAEGHVYGWVSWAQRGTSQSGKPKGILSLRNPYDSPGKITIDIGKAFELPEGAAQKYSLKSPWKKDADEEGIVLSAGKEHTFELGPFAVLVFDATPL